MSEPRTNESGSSSWGTPRSSDGDKGGPNQSLKGKPALTAQAANWPTATATDAKASGAAGYSTDSGRHSGTTLTDAIRAMPGVWPTPCAGAAHKEAPNKFQFGNPTLTALASRMEDGRHPQPIQKGGGDGVALNPEFVEALMGLPIHWTAPFLLRPTASVVSGTESSPNKPQPHSSSVSGGF
jgi:hypothetical protein